MAVVHHHVGDGPEGQGLCGAPQLSASITSAAAWPYLMPQHRCEACERAAEKRAARRAWEAHKRELGPTDA